MRRLNSRARATTPEVWERMGTTAEDVLPFIVQAAHKSKVNPAGGFARGFFAKLVPNVRKLGLLDANDGYLRQRWGEAGLLEFEFADDTGTDYTSYDAVAGPGGGVGGIAGRERGPERRAKGACHQPGAPRGGGAAVRRPHRTGLPGAGQALRHDQRGRHVHDLEGAQGGATDTRGVGTGALLSSPSTWGQKDGSVSGWTWVGSRIGTRWPR